MGQDGAGLDAFSRFPIQGIAFLPTLLHLAIHTCCKPRPLDAFSPHDNCKTNTPPITSMHYPSATFQTKRLFSMPIALQGHTIVPLYHPLWQTSRHKAQSTHQKPAPFLCFRRHSFFFTITFFLRRLTYFPLPSLFMYPFPFPFPFP